MQEHFEVKKDTFLNIQLLTLEEQKQRLKCPNNIEAFFVCTNSRCNIAGLVCRNSNCQCIKKHYKCKQIQIDRVLGSIEKHRKQSTQEFRKSYRATYQVINQMIDQLSNTKRKLELQEFYSGLTEPELSFITNIDQQQIDKICGKVVNEIKKTFDTQTNFIINSHEDILKDFEKYKRVQFDSICKHIKNFYMKFDQRRLDGLLDDSKIVKQSKQKFLMYKWLQETSNKQNFASKLLFRASEHNFSAAEFHKRCDGVENTLVIVKTEVDKVIGGFTPVKWSNERNEYVNDVTENSFLFSLTLKEKYKCTDSQKSILLYKDFGPIFGGGADLCLANNANKGNNTFANFPTSYNLHVNGIKKYQNHQQTWTLFSGATNSNYFTAKQYEVYKIK